ncbi:hypothetical protein EUGRSUZ_B00028 [Eucalyptus grandis]|uniref:Uncharacterized protein n=2 Tax=Eucalyptus grandis TaxID=71139 RepID=A0ACC3KIM0_EUCGR|nr:hypothetical protein EUGRSUZ_B00028 [Eucalyptus grandis]
MLVNIYFSYSLSKPNDIGTLSSIQMMVTSPPTFLGGTLLIRCSYVEITSERQDHIQALTIINGEAPHQKASEIDIGLKPRTRRTDACSGSRKCHYSVGQSCNRSSFSPKASLNASSKPSLLRHHQRQTKTHKDIILQPSEQNSKE